MLITSKGRSKKKFFISTQIVIMTIFTLFMGAGTSFFTTYNPFSIGFFILICCLFFLYKKVEHKAFGFKRLLNVLLVIGLWTLIHWTISGFADLAFVMVGVCVFAAFLLINYYRASLLDYYEKVAYALALIGLIGWGINNVIGSDLMATFAPFDTSDYNAAFLQNYPTGSFLFYNVGAWKGVQDIVPIELYRNQGYCWEAGRFASLTVLGLVIYLLQNKGIINLKSFKLWVYLIAIFSTFSTTGYVCTLIILGLFILFGNSIKKVWKIVLASLLVGIIISIQSSSFMNSKIEKQMDVTNFYSLAGNNSTSSGDFYTVERFEGIYLDWLNAVNAPIIGYGMTDMWSFVQQEISSSLVTSNGLTKVLARFGFFFGILYFFIFYRGCSRWVSVYGFNFKPILFITVLMLSVSYDFSLIPLILAMAFFEIFGLQSDKRALKS